MTEINKIDLIKPEAKIQTDKNKKDSVVTGKAFENKLLETVKKLETMGNEVDAMMKSAKPQIPKTIGNNFRVYSRKLDTLVENISAATQTSKKSAEFVASQYERMNPKKQS